MARRLLARFLVVYASNTTAGNRLFVMDLNDPRGQLVNVVDVLLVQEFADSMKKPFLFNRNGRVITGTCENI